MEDVEVDEDCRVDDETADDRENDRINLLDLIRVVENEGDRKAADEEE